MKKRKNLLELLLPSCQKKKKQLRIQEGLLVKNKNTSQAVELKLLILLLSTLERLVVAYLKHC